jgi:hypothetical protein
MSKERLAIEEPIEERCMLKKGSKKERDRDMLSF